MKSTANLRFNNCHGKAIVAFYADSLDGCSVEARVPAQLFQEITCPFDMRVGIAGIENGSVADDVVADDEGSGAGELDGPIEVVGIVGLVGVQEDKVKGGGLLGVESGEGIKRRAYADVNERRDAGTVKVGACYGRVLLLQFESDQAALRWKRARKPDGGVSAEGADSRGCAGRPGFGRTGEAACPDWGLHRWPEDRRRRWPRGPRPCWGRAG